jgi:hypothetical protein
MTIEHGRGHRDVVKVLFHLESEGGRRPATETLWAERIDQRRFRLRNVPFFVFGVSVEDVVLAQTSEDGVIEFEAVLIHSGHSTYRIMARAASSPEVLQQKWQGLEQLGCTYEQGPGSLRAVDVPPSADIYEVYKLLEQGEHEGVWEFEEGHCGHPVSG